MLHAAPPQRRIAPGAMFLDYDRGRTPIWSTCYKRQRPFARRGTRSGSSSSACCTTWARSCSCGVTARPAKRHAAAGVPFVLAIPLQPAKRHFTPCLCLVLTLTRRIDVLMSVFHRAGPTDTSGRSAATPGWYEDWELSSYPPLRSFVPVRRVLCCALHCNDLALLPSAAVCVMECRSAAASRTPRCCRT